MIRSSGLLVRIFCGCQERRCGIHVQPKRTATSRDETLGDFPQAARDPSSCDPSQFESLTRRAHVLNRGIRQRDNLPIVVNGINRGKTRVKIEQRFDAEKASRNVFELRGGCAPADRETFGAQDGCKCR